MKKSAKTNLYFVADRSGSMAAMAKEVIGGFNAFVKSQKKQPGEANLTYVQFDSEYEVIHDAVPISDVPKLTSEVYSARGMTALYDAVGKIITDGIAKSKPGDVNILNIITDGEENSSKTYTYEAVKALINLAQDKLGWEIVFLGANMDARSYGMNLGIKGKNIATFDASAAGATSAFNTMNFASTSYRGMSTGSALTPDMEIFIKSSDTSSALDDVYKKGN